jgi:hypothetical protein
MVAGLLTDREAAASRRSDLSPPPISAGLSVVEGRPLRRVPCAVCASGSAREGRGKFLGLLQLCRKVLGLGSTVPDGLEMSVDIAGEHRSRRLGAGKRNRHVGRAADDLRGAVGMSCSLIADQCFQNDQELLGEHGDVRSQMVRSSNAAWFVCQAIFAGSTKWFRDLAHSFTPPASRNHNSKIIRPLSDARAWRTVAMRASKRSVDFNVKQPKPRILAAPAAPEFCVS